MRAADLGAARVAIWGLGREGRAAIQFLRDRHPNLPLLLLDDAGDAPPPHGFENIECAFGPRAIAHALDRIDVVVKSPGVSLYRREISLARENGVAVTSLLNLWFAEGIGVTTICVTGTKGKSTTASLLAHILGQAISASRSPRSTRATPTTRSSRYRAIRPRTSTGGATSRC
jgi:UDP-N-acetylmuramoyl-L-alanine---L-glutamate ligase